MGRLLEQWRRPLICLCLMFVFALRGSIAEGEVAEQHSLGQQQQQTVNATTSTIEFPPPARQQQQNASLSATDSIEDLINASSSNSSNSSDGGGGSEIAGGGNSAEPRALAAPTLRGRQQQENAVEVNGERRPFFKIHYRDGIQKALFDETQRRVPADFEDTNDIGPSAGGEFDAYEDSRLVDPRLEQPLFIPEIYRNETSSEAKGGARGKGQPPPAAPQGIIPRPLVAPELQSRPPITVRTTTPRPLGGPPAPSIRPAQPFGRQQPPPGAPQQRPQPTQQIPPPARPPQGVPPRQPPLPPPGIPPQQPLRPPFQQPPPNQPQVLPRPPPFLPPLPSSPNPNPQQQRPQAPGGLGQLRSGVCPHSVFYTPQAVTEFDLQRIYTHFAVVVSVDQCARTCHEFNCDVAILDPISRHCQFNPSTAFRLHPACPQWPNPLYKNNVPAGQDPVRIACVTCQQRRRIPRPPNQNSPMPFSGQGRQQQQTFSVRRPTNQQLLPQAPPQVIRTTTRDRIDAGSAAAGSPFRIANAAPLHGRSGEDSPTGGGGRDLSAEFHKLERLLKSAEDYLDEAEQHIGRKGQRRQPVKRKKDAAGREVPSWRDGHPQGEGFSPLKINPLRRPFMAELPGRPQAIFYSTDTLSPRPTKLEDDSERKNNNEFRRRAHRDAEGPQGNPPEGADQIRSE